jgi:hypothetical protein
VYQVPDGHGKMAIWEETGAHNIIPERGDAVIWARREANAFFVARDNEFNAVASPKSFRGAEDG